MELFKEFKKDKRGYYSLILISIIFFIGAFAGVIANDRPIILKYKNKYYFPVFKESDDIFDDYHFKINYKSTEIIQKIEKNGWAIWPFIRYNGRSIVIDVENYPNPPNSRHIFGVDDSGRDVLAFLIHGIQISLFFSLLLTFAKIIIGFIIGFSQAYFKGLVDITLLRIKEILNIIPTIIYILIFSVFFEQTFWTFLLIMIALQWTKFAATVRIEVFKFMETGYILTAKAMGISDFRIMYRQLLPNLRYVFISYFPFSVSSSFATLASFDFIGKGLKVGTPSIGALLSQGINNIHQPSIAFIGVFFSSLILILFFNVFNSIEKIYQEK